MIHYTVRRSARARHVRLTISSQAKVEIVIPLTFDKDRVPEILAKKEIWIRRTIEKVRSRQALLPVRRREIPSEIYIPIIDTRFPVTINPIGTKRSSITEVGGRLVLAIDPSDVRTGLHLLQQWIHRKAKIILPPLLKKISGQHNLPYNEVRIRSQKTRWGSCSRKRNINLNRALILLPQPLVEYLFIHELCHTKEMNHSKRFWSLVELHCPDYARLDKELKESGDYVSLFR
jgi:hypothetical protein